MVEIDVEKDALAFFRVPAERERVVGVAPHCLVDPCFQFGEGDGILVLPNEYLVTLNRLAGNCMVFTMHF